jgi:hypothetical protein
MGSEKPTLPVEFLTVVAEQASPGSPAACFAAGQAQAMADGSDRERLLTTLLAGPYRLAAPAWLLEAGVVGGLGGATDHWPGSSIGLAVHALTHPDCTGDLRSTALRGCSEVQLAHLGMADRPAAIAQAVAVELRRRTPELIPMTRELLDQPIPAQIVLRSERLADAVFDTAVELLPTCPEPSKDDSENGSEWYKRYRGLMNAWATMWERVLRQHPDHHAALVERTEGGAAEYPIRHCLIAKLAWMVEPGLLKTLAVSDLHGFDAAVLTTKVCRMLRDGASKHAAREHFAAEIDALTASQQRLVSDYLEEDGLDPKWGCDAAVAWAADAAAGRWRLLLNPAKARPDYYGEPYAWRASERDLAELGRLFAQSTVTALELWEPNPGRPLTEPSSVRWVLDALTHLPEITDCVKDAVRSIIADVRTSQGNRTAYYRSVESRRETDEVLEAIARIVSDPAPQAAGRRAALGDPSEVTVRALSAVAGDVLAEYLDRHTGNDDLVEKTLLAIVSNDYRREPSFADVLARHSDPHRAINELTYDLRRRLGGNPPCREAWVRAILAVPGRDADTIRALPAWTALKTCENRNGQIGAEIIDAVLATLGDDADAWQRLGDSPIRRTGPGAWLRLGDVLDAARANTSWPQPPPAR